MSSEPSPAAPRTGPLLELSGVSVTYGPRMALESVDLRLAAGERVCLVGPNGAGKSTLLRCLTGILRPTTGEIRFDGRPLPGIPRVELARRVAVVPGSAHLPFAMRVEELVTLGRTPHLRGWGGLSEADRAAVSQALARAGIATLRDRDVRTLSLGERQMVLIAMALAQGGEVLVLDEPTVHLDLRHQLEVMRLLERLATEDGWTILAVLHDLPLARESFPRMALLDRGRLVADGRPQDVLSPDRVRDVYGVDVRYVSGAVTHLGVTTSHDQSVTPRTAA